MDCTRINRLIKEIKNFEANEMVNDITTVSQNISKQYKNKFIKHVSPTLEVHEDILIDKISMDARTYICAKGFCLKYYDRSHRRISNYNWIKLRTSTEEYIKIINQIATYIINISTCLNEKSHKIINKTVTLAESDTQHEVVNEKKCVYCEHPKLTKLKHIHFVKETPNYMTENIKN